MQLQSSIEDMGDEERNVWLKHMSAVVEEKSILNKEVSRRSFRAHDVAEIAPKEYVCPISLELMRDPVLLVESGQVYDRSSIEGWFKSGKSSCPVSGMKLNTMRLSPIFPLRSAIQTYAAAQKIELETIDSVSDEMESPRTDFDFAGNVFDGVSVYDVKGLWQLVNGTNQEQQALALQLLADMTRFGDACQKKHVSKMIRMDKLVGLYRHGEHSVKTHAARLLLHLPVKYFNKQTEVQLLMLNSPLLREELLMKLWSYCYRYRSRMMEIARYIAHQNSEEIISICKKISDPTENSEVSDELRTCATLILACGAFRLKTKKILIEQGAIPMLIHSLNRTPNVGFRFCLMKSIQYLCEDPQGRSQVILAGGVRLFVLHLPPRNNSVHYSTRVFLDWSAWVTVAETCVKALYFLSFAQQGRVDMRTTATLKALRIMFNSSHYPDSSRARYLSPLLSRISGTTGTQ